jgi:hypothetical protein
MESSKEKAVGDVLREWLLTVILIGVCTGSTFRIAIALLRRR